MSQSRSSVQYWLWDATADGRAARPAPSRHDPSRGEDDLDRVRTAVLAPRFLVGSGIALPRVHAAIDARPALPAPARFIAEQNQKAPASGTPTFGDSLYLLQPNVKEGAGGLRDYHAPTGRCRRAQPGLARDRDDFLHLGLLTEDRGSRGAHAGARVPVAVSATSFT